MRVPAHVQDLLVEVDLIRIGLLAHALCTTGWRACTASLLAVLTSTSVHRRGDADLLRLECALVGLQHNLGVLVRVARVNHKVVVVGSSHDVSSITRESHLELVEDAVVFVCVAQSGAEMLVNGNRLDWLALHVHVPDLDGEIIAREDVSAIMAEADVRNGRNNLGEE